MERPTGLRRLIGSMLISFGIVMFIYLIVFAINKKTRDDALEVEAGNIQTRIYKIEQEYKTYDDLDVLFERGDYYDMFELYKTKVSEISMVGYRRKEFLSLYDTYVKACDSYNEYMDQENRSKFYYTQWLFYGLEAAIIPDEYVYSLMSSKEKEIIFEKSEEIKLIIADFLEIAPEEVSGYADRFRDENGNYSYSMVSEYTEKVFGE